MEQAIRVLKRKLQKEGFFKVMKMKSTYEKPSEKKKRVQTENLKRIKKLQKLKYNVTGPLAADTIFLKNNRKKFDVIVGMYHDQVLTPLKTLFEYDAINITLGLPFLRISPDHGPNEKMLGKNLSNPLSLLKAIKFLDKNWLKPKKA